MHIPLQVLGKREFRLLLAWRLKMAEAWKKASSLQGGEAEGEEKDGVGEEGSDDEADRQEEEISELERLQRQRLKGAKRKAAEKRAKLKERLALKMEHPGDRLDIRYVLRFTYRYRRYRRYRCTATPRRPAGYPGRDGALLHVQDPLAERPREGNGRVVRNGCNGR